MRRETRQEYDGYSVRHVVEEGKLYVGTFHAIAGWGSETYDLGYHDTCAEAMDAVREHHDRRGMTRYKVVETIPKEAT